MNTHIVDAVGLVFAISWMLFFSLFLRRWYFAMIVGGGGFWIILDFTGRLLARLDPLRGWNPSDTIWTCIGWLFGIVAALSIVFLKHFWLRLIRKNSNAA